MSLQPFLPHDLQWDLKLTYLIMMQFSFLSFRIVEAFDFLPKTSRDGVILNWYIPDLVAVVFQVLYRFYRDTSSVFITLYLVPVVVILMHYMLWLLGCSPIARRLISLLSGLDFGFAVAAQYSLYFTCFLWYSRCTCRTFHLVWFSCYCCLEGTWYERW